MNEIILFEQKQVRRVWDESNQKWFYSIVDVLAVLTESIDPGAYWRKLKERLKAEGNETVTNCHSLKIEAADGNFYNNDVFKGGGQIVPPLGFEFDTEGEPQKMRKRDAELGTYIGTNCPHVEMSTHTNKKTETVKLGIKQKYESVVKKKLNCRQFVYS